jgi:hypothetical protein
MEPVSTRELLELRRAVYLDIGATERTWSRTRQFWAQYHRYEDMKAVCRRRTLERLFNNAAAAAPAPT